MESIWKSDKKVLYQSLSNKIKHPDDVITGSHHTSWQLIGICFLPIAAHSREPDRNEAQGSLRFIHTFCAAVICFSLVLHLPAYSCAGHPAADGDNSRLIWSWSLNLTPSRLAFPASSASLFYTHAVILGSQSVHWSVSLSPLLPRFLKARHRFSCLTFQYPILLLLSPLPFNLYRTRVRSESRQVAAELCMIELFEILPIFKSKGKKTT